MNNNDIKTLSKSMNELESKLDLVLYQIEQTNKNERSKIIKKTISFIPSLIVLILIIASLVFLYNKYGKQYIKF